MARTRPVLTRRGAAAARAAALVGALVCIACALAAAQSTAPSAEAIAAEARVQRGYALRAFIADAERIERVAYPLLRAAAPYCADRQRFTFGAGPRTAAGVPPALRDAAAELGLGDEPSFTLVVDGSPAALAGVQRGDRLLSVNGQPVPAGPPGLPWVMQVVDRQWQATQQPLRLGLRRDGRTLELPLTPQPQCAPALRLVMSDVVNAGAGVNQLMVSSGMLRFAADDTELALVIGHELGHAVLRHPDALAAAARARGDAPGATPPRDPYSLDRERDADRLGLYIAAAAGFDISRAPELWRRMAVRAPGTIANSPRDGLGPSHPSSPERFLLLQAVAAEIAERRQRGDAPLPPLAELKLRPEAADAAPPAPQPLPALAQLGALNDDTRAAYQAFTAAAERPRALALSLRGHVSMRAGPNAASDALAACNVLARGACRLVALDDDWLGAGFVSLGAR